MNFESTAEVPIPKDPLERVIGQDEAVKISRKLRQQLAGYERKIETISKQNSDAE